MTRRKAPLEGAEYAAGSHLTLAEEKFAEAYCENGGNATQAYIASHPGVLYDTARKMGPEWCAKVRIQEAIESTREQWRELVKIDRKKILRVYAGIAFSTADEFADVLKDPSKKENYRGLGHKKHAIESVEKSTKNGNKVKFVNKLAALNELWEKCGLKSEDDKGNGKADPDAILRAVSKILGE